MIFSPTETRVSPANTPPPLSLPHYNTPRLITSPLPLFPHTPHFKLIYSAHNLTSALCPFSLSLTYLLTPHVLISTGLPPLCSLLSSYTSVSSSLPIFPSLHLLLPHTTGVPKVLSLPPPPFSLRSSFTLTTAQIIVSLISLSHSIPCFDIDTHKTALLYPSQHSTHLKKKIFIGKIYWTHTHTYIR